MVNYEKEDTAKERYGRLPLSQRPPWIFAEAAPVAEGATG